MRAKVWLAVAAVFLAGIPNSLSAESDGLSALNKQFEQYFEAGNWSYAEGVLAGATLDGHAYPGRVSAWNALAWLPDQPDVATVLDSLARLYRAKGYYSDAELLLRRSLAIREKSLGPYHPDVATALNNLAELYRSWGPYPVDPLFRRSLAIREWALGPDHPDVATALNRLAEVYSSEGRYSGAEPLFRRSLAIREKVLGPDHPDVATVLNNLALLYYAEGRYPEAEPLFRRSLAIREKALGPDHPDVATALNNLALLYYAEGRYPDEGGDATALMAQVTKFRSDGKYTEAIAVQQRVLALREKALGPEHPDVGEALDALSVLYGAEGRYSEAEPLLKRSLAIDEKALGSDHPNVARVLNNLGDLYRSQGRYTEAEPLLKRALDIREKALAPDHPGIATSLNCLALLYRDEGRDRDAQPFAERSLGIREKALGPDHPDVGSALNNLADLYKDLIRHGDQGAYAEAEPLYKRALAIAKRALGPDHPDVGTRLSNLAELYRTEGRYRSKARSAEAGPLFQQALAIYEKALGPDSPDVGMVLERLGLLYLVGERAAEAEPLLKRSLAIREKALGSDHPHIATMLNNRAEVYFAQGDWVRAADAWRRGTSITTRNAQRGAQSVGHALTGQGEQNSLPFWGLVKADYRLTMAENAHEARLASETFQTAQWARSSQAAAGLAQMASRGAAGNPALAALTRERQDLVAEWQNRDAARTAALSQRSDERNKEGEAIERSRLSEIETRVGEFDKQLAKDFPDYAALANPTALSIADVQSQLRDGEALIFFLDTPEFERTPEETFIWAVTKTESRWVKSDVDTNTLHNFVTALRCGLDFEGIWPGACAMLLKVPYSELDHDHGKRLPFNLSFAHDLYMALFGKIDDLIKDKHLLIVPSSVLTQLPYQVLVSEKPDSALSGLDALRHAAWLIRSHALTLLPSVPSLKALRELAKDSHASRALIGFGNPLLDGQPDQHPDDGPRAARARAEQSCPRSVGPQVVKLEGGHRAIRPVTLRGGVADVAEIRMQVPLPETADELCAVARDLGVGEDDVRLGARATEDEIKRLSDAGELAKYHIIHFATHGALAGQVDGDFEPGLLLTPPNQPTATDDGYLSASEVASLKIDADWVILSACNTAAGDARTGEALSGLARAFFYAGARALLVSHWSVNSKATVQLITKAVAELKTNPSIGRAEAMRRSMLAMIDNGAPYEANPAYWSPFSVVGEGGSTSMPSGEVSATVTGIIAVPAATPAETNSEASTPKAEVIVAPAPPVTGAAPTSTAQTPVPSTDEQASSVKKGATKKTRRKSKSDDWFTSFFGQ